MTVLVPAHKTDLVISSALELARHIAEQENVPRQVVKNTFQIQYRDDPVAFAYDCINWPTAERLAPYQEEILVEVPIRKRVSVRGPHGLGKSTLLSIETLWFALTRDGEDWKIPTLASN